MARRETEESSRARLMYGWWASHDVALACAFETDVQPCEHMFSFYDQIGGVISGSGALESTSSNGSMRSQTHPTNHSTIVII